MGSNDPANFSRWFDAYAARLVLYARQWLPAAEAEDAVQEVFVRLIDRRAEPANAAAWLFTAVQREAVDRHRSAAARRRREQAVAEDRQSWFTADPAGMLDASTAQSAIADLPPMQREIVTLRIWGGLSFSAIARVIGSADSTVHDQYKAALAAIRKRLEPTCPTQMIRQR